ncbi:VanZ family protein [Streptomyces sp. NBC_00178]|uniref:VanZ family protein n=1 Tax=Streptomyces sp. NBC_00178 TaxID=2975672 RepID=UPI002E2D124F|nr:VanZ family protein [Streptomyces sp. NBC_00178]
MTAEADRSTRRRSVGRLLLRAAVLAAAFLALVAFSVVLAKVTLTPSPASEDIVTSNMKPGRSLRQYAEDYTFLAACKQAGGNILLGTPFGVLLPILVPRRLRMLRMTLLTVLVMAVVELTQGALVAGRAFDIDDVILNTTGALLGYLVVGRRVSHRYHALADEPVVADEGGAESRTPAKDVRAGAGPKPGLMDRFRGGKRGGAEGKPGPVGARTASGVAAKSGSRPTARRSAPAVRGRALLDKLRGRRGNAGGGANLSRRRGA